MNDQIRKLAEQADGVVINKMMTGARWINDPLDLDLDFLEDFD